MKFSSASTLVILNLYFFRLFPVIFTAAYHRCSVNNRLVIWGHSKLLGYRFFPPTDLEMTFVPTCAFHSHQAASNITQVAPPTTPSKLGFYHLLNSLQCRNLVETPQWRGNNWMRWEHGKQSMDKVCGSKPLETWPPRILLEHYRWTVMKAKK